MSYHERMRIVCPSCAATYDVPDAALAPGRPVRCTRCGTEWAPLSAAPPALAPGAGTGRSLRHMARQLPPNAPEPRAVSGPERVPQIPTMPIAPPRPTADARRTEEPEELPPEELPPKELAHQLPHEPRVLPGLLAAEQDEVGLPIARSHPRRGPTSPLPAWLASLVLLVALAGAAYIWRAPIMTAWPPSERLYAALGLAHPGPQH